MSKQRTKENTSHATIYRSTGLLSLGLVSGVLASFGWASMSPPTEHKGLEVESLGAIAAKSMASWLGSAVATPAQSDTRRSR